MRQYGGHCEFAVLIPLCVNVHLSGRNELNDADAEVLIRLLHSGSVLKQVHNLASLRDLIA